MKSYFLAFNFLRLACYPLSFFGVLAYIFYKIQFHFSRTLKPCCSVLSRSRSPSFRGRKTYIIMPLFLCQALLAAFLGHKISTSH